VIKSGWGEATFDAQPASKFAEVVTMKTLIRRTAWVFLTLNLAAQSTSIAGTWRAEFGGPGGATVSERLDLAVKAGVVTGTFTNAVGVAGTIRDGKWDGSTLRFWVAWNPGRLQAVGRMDGSTLRVDLTTSEWKATRAFNRIAKSSTRVVNLP
jgi:hypothetical protein